MRLRHALSFSTAIILGGLTATSVIAEVRFNLRGHVPAVCAIEDQRAYSDGSATLVDLRVNCNLSAFSLSSPGASAVTLRSHRLIAGGGNETPVITGDGDSVEFADLRPGRREITLRITSPMRSIGVALDTQ